MMIFSYKVRTNRNIYMGVRSLYSTDFISGLIFFFNSICVEIKFKPFSVAPKDNVTIIDMFTTGENHAELNFHEKVIFKGKPSIHPFLFSCLYFSS